MSTTATWGDVVAWAKSEIEKARTSLETVTDHGDITRIQARAAVMRELIAIPDIPKAPELPPSVPY